MAKPIHLTITDLDDGEVIHSTLASFVKFNRESRELVALVRKLKAGETIRVGGGASPRVKIHRVAEAKAARSSATRKAAKASPKRGAPAPGKLVDTRSPRTDAQRPKPVAGFRVQPIDHRYFNSLRYFFLRPRIVEHLTSSVYVIEQGGRYYVGTHEKGIGYFSTFDRFGSGPIGYPTAAGPAKHWKAANAYYD